jgi:dTDP-4-dehydrorhamnose reductase
LVTDTPNPINEYGKSKLIGEQNIEEVLDNYFIIRTSWLYSKNYGKNFYRAILEKAKKEKEMYITDEQIGCPTDTINLSRFIIDLITKKNEKYGVHHFCDNKIMTWFGFAEYILKKNQLFNSINLVKVDKYVTFAKRPKNSILK